MVKRRAIVRNVECLELRLDFSCTDRLLVRSIGSVEYFLDDRIKVDAVELAINPRPCPDGMRIGGCAETRDLLYRGMNGVMVVVRLGDVITLGIDSDQRVVHTALFA
ncbi:MAG: hypothetical protein OXT74_07965 [Candidatus Poribacteria bacterium]|nr:hypothetical protein [Candidatus Poribacteria bacterium]